LKAVAKSKVKQLLLDRNEFRERELGEDKYATTVCDQMKLMKLTHFSRVAAFYYRMKKDKLIRIVAACEGTNMKLLDISCHGISEEDCSHVSALDL
jgi:hypothetical protein